MCNKTENKESKKSFFILKGNQKKKANEKKNDSFWNYIKFWLLYMGIAFILLYVIVYFCFFSDGFIPVGEDLCKSDWLSFLGAFLSLAGSTIVALIATFQNSYNQKQSEKKEKENRNKQIRPIFSIKIDAINMPPDGTPESICIVDPSRSSKFKNVKISIENANCFPITHLIVFDKYIAPLLKSGDVMYIYCTYPESYEAKKWPEKFILLTKDNSECDEDGIPLHINLNYEDIDGNGWYQIFDLKDFGGTKYYSLISTNEEL